MAVPIFDYLLKRNFSGSKHTGPKRESAQSQHADCSLWLLKTPLLVSLQVLFWCAACDCMKSSLADIASGYHSKQVSLGVGLGKQSSALTSAGRQQFLWIQRGCCCSLFSAGLRNEPQAMGCMGRPGPGSQAAWLCFARPSSANKLSSQPRGFHLRSRDSSCISSWWFTLPVQPSGTVWVQHWNILSGRLLSESRTCCEIPGQD